MKTCSSLLKPLFQMGQAYEKIANNYIPNNPLSLLIIGESPPSNGKYFYSPIDNCHWQSLPAKVFRVLFPQCPFSTKSDYQNRLNDFKSYNYYQIDLCTIPLDILLHVHRVKIIKNHFQRFCIRFRKLSLSQNCYVIVVLPSKSYDLLNTFLQQKLNNCNLLSKRNVTLTKWNDLESELLKIKNNILPSA